MLPGIDEIVELAEQYVKNKENFKYLFENSAPQNAKRSILGKR